jgi:hypothetical protein
MILVLGKNAEEMFKEFQQTNAEVVYLKHPAWFIRNGKTWKDYLKHIKIEVKKGRGK